MRIQHNIMAMSAYRNYTNNVSAMKKNLEKLSSGYKINRAGDDAAGLAISEKMRAQITGLETAQKNAKDGISLVQTAEGALTEVHDMLNRMVELATQSANGTYEDTTDRTQLQKEVNQLLSEINRIADSSNFNGINLLDGTLGLNTDAFKIGDAAAVSASDGTVNISSLLAAKDAGKPAVHLEEAAATAATPSAKIDLNNLNVKVEGSSTGTLKFEINKKEYTVSLNNSNSGAKTFDAAEIATLLAAELNKDINSSDGGTSSADAMKVGNAAFTATAAAASGANGTITLTYAGNAHDGTNYQNENAFSGDNTAATAINNSLGFDVTVKGVTNGTQIGDVVHKATDVEQAKAAKAASMAGIDLKLNDTIVKNGNVLEIDGKKFQFKTSADGFTADTEATLIDLTTEKEDNWIHAAADKLSKQTTFAGADSRQWKIGVTGDGKTIHIEQKVGTANTAKPLSTYEDLTSKISVKGKATNEKFVGTEIDIIDPSKVAEGNTLTIGEGDNAVKYVFTKDLTGKTDDAKTKYVQFSEGGADAAANLQTKIGGTSELNGNKVIVRAAAAADKAPMVLGKGLTLQIGDTSDSWNQLNVAVQDMHAKSLGIDNLKINTEESAQQAIKKIKDAINTVSDVRGTLGATQNRLDHTINNLSVMTENIQDAESTIRDVDVAEEMMAYTKNNILIQSAQAMLAQANQVPQGVLQLLQ